MERKIDRRAELESIRDVLKAEATLNGGKVYFSRTLDHEGITFTFKEGRDASYKVKAFHYTSSNRTIWKVLVAFSDTISEDKKGKEKIEAITKKANDMKDTLQFLHSDDVKEYFDTLQDETFMGLLER